MKKHIQNAITEGYSLALNYKLTYIVVRIDAVWKIYNERKENLEWNKIVQIKGRTWKDAEEGAGVASAAIKLASERAKKSK